MGALSARPNTFFRLSPADAEAGTGFVVRRGDIRERLDPTYLGDIRILAGRYSEPTFPLVTIGSITTLAQYGTSERSVNEPLGVPVLRIPNLQEDGWSLDDLKYLELSDDLLGRFRLESGDILFNRTNGSRTLIGKCDVFDFDGDWVFASYLIRLRLDFTRANPYFVSAFLNTKWGRRQVEHASRQILMSNINIEEIKNLRIPLPPLNEQTALISVLHEERKSRDESYSLAERSLSKIDDFICEALGLPLGTPTESRLHFAVRRLSVLQGKKLFPTYYEPGRQNAVAALRRTGSARLTELVSFERSSRTIESSDTFYVGLANIAAHTGEFIDIEETVDGTVTQFAAGDILFAKLRPYLNKVWVADRAGVCSPEFHVLRLRPGGRVVSADFLATALRSSAVLAQTTRMMTGNTHPRLASEDVANLVIPTPAQDLQRAIAVEVDQRRTNARELRRAAELRWAGARQAFEDAVLGPAT